jgi:hypothetical protein
MAVTRSVIGKVGLWGLLLHRYGSTKSSVTREALSQIIPGDNPYLQAESRGGSNKTVEPRGRAWQSVGWTQRRKNSILARINKCRWRTGGVFDMASPWYHA